jgi:hypothetical protein
MRNSFPVLVLLLFLGACGTPSHQLSSDTSSQPTSAAPSQPPSGAPSQPPPGTPSQPPSQPPSGTGSQPNSTVTYESNSWTVSSLNAVTGELQLGGNFVSPDSMGSGCYYGGCPDWQFSNYAFSYHLPDGTTADLLNFSGTANFTDQSNVQVSGTASGNDSTGTAVQVSVSWAWAASCKSGRDGGCRKKYISGKLTVMK